MVSILSKKLEQSQILGLREPSEREKLEGKVVEAEQLKKLEGKAVIFQYLPNQSSAVMGLGKLRAIGDIYLFMENLKISPDYCNPMGYALEMRSLPNKSSFYELGTGVLNKRYVTEMYLLDEFCKTFKISPEPPTSKED